MDLVSGWASTVKHWSLTHACATRQPCKPKAEAEGAARQNEMRTTSSRKNVQLEECSRVPIEGSEHAGERPAEHVQVLQVGEQSNRFRDASAEIVVGQVPVKQIRGGTE